MDSGRRPNEDSKSRRVLRNTATQPSNRPELPRLQALPRASNSKGLTPALPPKLGIKKRKPRSSAVISAANERARAATAPLPVPPATTSPPAKVVRAQPETTTRRPESRVRAKVDRGGAAEVKRKGLRHFAVRVSKKVETKMVTTYNEVADELVAEETMLKKTELANGGTGAIALQKKLEKNGTLVDEKNIRRRVYDSLNVLMAMGIIAKEKKLITWQGLAMAQSARESPEVTTLKGAIAEKRRVLEEKRRALQEVQDQYRLTASLVERNRELASGSDSIQDILGGVGPLLPVHQHFPTRLGLPFVIISAAKDTSIELEMDKTQEDIRFTFDDTFQIFDEKEILKRISLVPATESLNRVVLNDFDRLSDGLVPLPSGASIQ